MNDCRFGNEYVGEAKLMGGERHDERFGGGNFCTPDKLQRYCVPMSPEGAVSPLALTMERDVAGRAGQIGHIRKDGRHDYWVRAAASGTTSR